MKRISKYLLVLVGACSLSCDALELGAEDFYSINNYWNSESQCERFMVGLHARLRSRSRSFLVMGELRGGLLSTATTTSIGESAADLPVVQNNLSESNPGVTNWGNFYMDIYQINHAIDKISGACEFLSDQTRSTFLGQLYGLRAYYYFHLLRTWGGVPLCDRPDVLMTDDISQLNKARSTERETWQFVRDDAERSCLCYESLGFEHYKGKNCYWNKAASLCLKAEVCLWGAQVKPIGEETVLSPDPEADLKAACDALTAVEAQYGFCPSFADVFSPAGKDQNRENILALRFKLGEATNDFGDFTYNPTLITKFLDADGNRLANPFNIASGALRYEYTRAFYDRIDDADTRKRATFLQFYDRNADNEIVPAGRSLRKFLGEVNNGRVQFTNDYPLYRYMDVALMLAEVNNCLDRPEEVKRWIERARMRAYGAAAMPAFVYTDAEAAAEAILAERSIEFVAEGKRWYDIRRMLGGKHALELVGGDERKLVWPIDAGVLAKDNLVEQNEGYR